MNNSKSILVTGSNGFIGRKLVQLLRERKFVVEEFDQANGDISEHQLAFCNVGHVFHLASQTYVPDSWERPLGFYRTNVLGTANILELCRKQGCSITYISSYVYGPPIYLPVDEKHPIHPASPYNHSKLVAEDICKYYSETFQVPIAILRPVNVYGPGQRGDFLIPTIIKQMLDPTMKSISVKDTRPKRDYLYIDDFLNALLCTIGINGFEIYNIGSGYSVSVEDIIITALRCAGISKTFNSENSERKNEIWDVYADISKFRERFCWKPQISFEEGISQCIKA